MSDGAPQPGVLPVLALRVAPAVVGGLLALPLVDVATEWTVFALVFAVLVGALVAALAGTAGQAAFWPRPARSGSSAASSGAAWRSSWPEQKGPAATPEQAGRSVQPEAEAASTFGGAHRRADEPASRLVLGADQRAGELWWGRQPATGQTHPASRPLERPQPLDLTGYLDSARVVQCPRCGAFRIDVWHQGGGFAFHCQVDGHQWEWQPGTGWPPTVVVSRRRTGAVR
jgi:hypothetical protein